MILESYEWKQAIKRNNAYVSDEDETNIKTLNSPKVR